MTHQETVPSKTDEQPAAPGVPAASAPAKPKEDPVKDALENYSKLEKTRSVLHGAGNVQVGQTPHEIVAETRAYRLLHYQPVVSKTAKTPILTVYALINKSYVLDL